MNEPPAKCRPENWLVQKPSREDYSHHYTELVNRYNLRGRRTANVRTEALRCHTGLRSALLRNKWARDQLTSGLWQHSETITISALAPTVAATVRGGAEGERGAQ
jgi:hypothetical protein